MITKTIKNLSSALSLSDITAIFGSFGDGCDVLINGNGSYEISYNYNNGSPIVDIRNTDNERI